MYRLFQMHYDLLKKRHDWLKNPFVLAGTVLPWVALIGLLEPHSERVSFAHHRYSVMSLLCPMFSFIFLKELVENGF